MCRYARVTAFLPLSLTCQFDISNTGWSHVGKKSAASVGEVHRMGELAPNSSLSFGFLSGAGRGDLNPHSPFGPADFKSAASYYKLLYLNELLSVIS